MPGLSTYEAKRDFSRTREPRGRKAKSAGFSFVVQKHAARQLHYDFRLELDGVLKSWAVTKGPSLVPGEKRLAVEVEDHPLDYRDFEGTIPKGQYGGGSVIVWDRGSWTPDGDPHRGLAKGHLDFSLEGEKLHGRWHLVRMRGRPGERRTNWLLIKGDDEAARRSGDPDILQEHPESVISGKSVEEVGEDPDAAQWQSSRPAKKPARNSDKQPVTLTHPDRIYWPDVGVTKQRLADYYAEVWKWIAPHVVARPLALLRCPGGTNRCFFQKQPWKGLHPSISVVANRGAGGRQVLAIADLDGLTALVQSGVLEIHPWSATVGDLDHPDRLIFDLDPGPGVAWADLARAARLVRDHLKDAGLESFVKTTGGKGLHVVAPIMPEADWDTVKSFAHDLAERLAEETPERYLATASKQARKGRIFVDYLRNARGASSVAAYSTRARPGAPVSVPLAWEELRTDARGDHFNVTNVPTRLKRQRSDPWARFFKIKQRLPRAR